MARPVQVGDIRDLLGKVLDAGGLKRKRAARRKRKSISVAGNVVHVKVPCVHVNGADEKGHCDVTLRVTLIVLGGCAIAATCILGSVYFLKDALW